MRKTCKTCALGKIKYCPIMLNRPKYFCFAWCKTKAEWEQRLSECKIESEETE